MPNLTRIIQDALRMPDEALKYELNLRMHDLYPDKFILETEDFDFGIKSFVEAGRCLVMLLDDMHPQLEAEWASKSRGASLVPRNCFQEIVWKGYRLRVLTITYGDCDCKRHYIVADSRSEAKEFFASVCAFSSEVTGEILVFRHGHWCRDKELLEQISQATFDGLILPQGVRDALTEDVAKFFEAREIYRKHGVAWKRGVLLLGPPGNGKTHAIKALINSLGKPAIYVRTFKTAKGTVHAAVETVFQKAREVAPCLLILEDLDTLIDETSLSFFLNEMDGFASNEGILTLATTNHPEKIDKALLERPSRFDRKITFSLPALDERLAYFAATNERREPDLKMELAEVRELANRTDGFSFAYLKELCLSATMVWMRDSRPGGMAEAMLSQVETLRAQMKSEPPQTPSEEEDDD